jgi:hypothetical protein
MTDIYADFEKKKKRIEDHKESKRKDRYAKGVSRLKHYTDDSLMSPPSTDRYRDNYSRIFGHK